MKKISGQETSRSPFSNLTRILFILFFASNCFGQSSMTKTDFPEHGVKIVLPGDPNYSDELGKLGFSADSTLLQPMDSVILVKNISHREIASIGVRFTKRLANGTVTTSDVVANKSSALLDSVQSSSQNNHSKGLIEQDSSLLVAPEGIIVPGRKRTNQAAEPWVVTDVQIDCIVFADGEVIGPDQLGVVKALKAHVDAQQDLMEEISRRISQGQSMRDALQAIAMTSTGQDAGDMSNALDPVQIYSIVRQRYLKELLTTEKNYGEEVAMSRLQKLKYRARPTFRQNTGGN